MVKRHSCIRETRRPSVVETPTPVLLPLDPPMCPIEGREPEDPGGGCDQTTVAGGPGVTTTWHRMGTQAGQVTLDYNMFFVPDELDVYDLDGALLATTSGPVSGTGTLLFDYIPIPSTPDPLRLNAYSVRVVVTGPINTGWEYVISCPVPP